jgi:hypothetical protein
LLRLTRIATSLNLANRLLVGQLRDHLTLDFDARHL